MGLKITAVKLVAIGVLAGFSSLAALAETPAEKPAEKPLEAATETPKVSPIGIGSDWSADVSADADVSGQTFGETEIAIITRVNSYFNSIEDLKGAFIQTSSDDRKAKGKFFVKRPGRFRFVYSPPSKLVILSNGEQLLIEDHDLKTVDRFPIDSTPFRLLLKKDVDILRDARVTGVEETEDRISITIHDKKSDSSGKIQLLFTKSPEVELELSEWIITDAQGLDTRIQIAQLNRDEKVDARMFDGSKIDMPDFSE